MAECWITDQPLRESETLDLVKTPRAGAVVLFIGTARNHAEGRPVAALEYEAYAAMAEAEMRALAEEALRRWPVEKIAVVHRTGRLDIGGAAVMAAVSSAHRKEAFEACAFLMDAVKERVPIWKKEHWADGGARWVNDDQQDDRQNEEA